ncbi:MAG: hypothetical protein KZQ58_04305 [gamma proteobacterium symbiont of Bathyaustriella thionipta]|nr:hypothetical protein [gamma proteobacterium symbiont of Bathyaustriella thionipta]
MNKILTMLVMSILLTYACSSLAGEELATEDTEETPMTAEEVAAEQQILLTMADETLQRLYKDNPAAEKKIEDAYGYGVFEGQTVNLVVYVAGKGMGVVFDKETKTPVYMHALRAGTGPGVGYKSSHVVVLFDNETVYDQFTTIGLHASASADATVKVMGMGSEMSGAVSLVPGISAYHLTDSGLVVQANWGAVEFLKDPDLNP